MLASTSSTLRGRIVLVAVAALVALQVFAILVSGVSAHDSAVAAAREGIVREGGTTSEAILRHLEPAEQSVEVSTRLLAAELIETASPGLERYLFTQLAVMPQVTGAFVAFPDGGFAFVSVDGDGYRAKRITVDPVRSVVIDTYTSEFELAATEVLLLDEFDPVERPWYAAAAATDDLSWTDPYVFFSSQEPGVTVSKAVRVDGDVVAVVGVDVELSGLAAFLDELQVAEAGEAFVMSGDDVIGAPSAYETRIGRDRDGTLRLLTADEVGVPDLDPNRLATVQRISTDDGAQLVYRSEFPAQQSLGWSLVIRAPEQSFTAIADAQQRTSLLITLGGAALVLLAVWALFRVSRPIQQAQEWATVDALTGLSNRRHIDVRGAAMLARVEPAHGLAVMVLDLDGFKTLNDLHGHHTGDRALSAVADVLATTAPPKSLVGRLGGDEFIVATPVADVADAVAAGTRVMDGVRAELAAHFGAAAAGVSGGLTVGFDPDADFAELLIDADGALLTAKSDYKGMLRLSDSLVPSAS